MGIGNFLWKLGKAVVKNAGEASSTIELKHIVGARPCSS
jgi:hypothetical protein